MRRRSGRPRGHGLGPALGASEPRPAQQPIAGVGDDPAAAALRVHGGLAGQHGHDELVEELEPLLAGAQPVDVGEAEARHAPERAEEGLAQDLRQRGVVEPAGQLGQDLVEDPGRAASVEVAGGGHCGAA
ncbi:MAG: hypothetical protein R3F30_02180 [Planctomycetota bacterium]